MRQLHPHALQITKYIRTMRDQTIDEQEHNQERQDRNREDMDRRYEMEIEDRQNDGVIEEIVNTNYLYL